MRTARVVNSEIHAKARSAADWEPIVPLPPLIAATGASVAVWSEKTSICASGRMIVADGGVSPGLFTFDEVYVMADIPTPSEIRRQTAVLQESWSDAERRRRAPHLVHVETLRIFSLPEGEDDGEAR